MATDPPPPHQQPAQSTSTYSAQHASSLFDAFLHQSHPALPPPTSPSANSDSLSQQPSPSALSLAQSPSASSSSSLAAALGSHSPSLPGGFEGQPLPAVRSPEPNFSSPSGPDTEGEDGQSPSTSEAQKSKIHQQPLTAHGKPRARVYLACLQWSVPSVRICPWEEDKLGSRPAYPLSIYILV